MTQNKYTYKKKVSRRNPASQHHSHRIVIFISNNSMQNLFLTAENWKIIV